MAITTPPTTKATSDTSAKGLATGKVGLIGAVVIGISCIAPTYTLTSGAWSHHFGGRQVCSRDSYPGFPADAAGRFRLPRAQ